MNNNKGTLKVTVRDEAPRRTPIEGALVKVCLAPPPALKAQKEVASLGPVADESNPIETKATDRCGQAEFKLNPRRYRIFVDTFLKPDPEFKDIDVTECGCSDLTFEIGIGLDIELSMYADDRTWKACPDVIVAGAPVRIRAAHNKAVHFRNPVEYRFDSSGGVLMKIGDQEAILETAALKGEVILGVMLRETNTSSVRVRQPLRFISAASQAISGGVSVSLRRSELTLTADMAFWTIIRSATAAISFNNYQKFMDDVMCGRDPNTHTHEECEYKSLPFPGVEAYSLVKCATEIFLMTHCGVKKNNHRFDMDEATLLEEQNRYGRDITAHDLEGLWNSYLVGVNGDTVKTIPYLALIRSRLGGVPLKDDSGTTASELANCFGILRSKLANPCLLELIWSYWQEEGTLVQTMKAISLRFQNRTLRDRDPLMRFDIDPLRPMANLLWGYIQDEQHRLSVLRRSYEYSHHYGVTLQGRAAPPLRTADSRSKFLEAFHNLLYLCAIFYKEDDDTTVIADGFPIMNAIREVHLLLAEGAHNQFGDLLSTARQEMLIEQWLLARPEMREFLGGRIMVPYSEVWMDRVDTVKRLQGWTDTNVTEFHYLATYGEEILLSIRYGNWSDINDPTHAANWARYWRPEIQSYIHSYRAVTGVDLTQEPSESHRPGERYIPPSVHLRRRLELQLARK
jgi:hypothetical protein